FSGFSAFQSSSAIALSSAIKSFQSKNENQQFSENFRSRLAGIDAVPQSETLIRNTRACCG
ncbi:hypothetical protein, partial [Brucella sp.]|uniref:hypothetical protein n=1 Tax=Brucella sp. TaxID=52132 RepID=UPI00289E60C6